MKLIFKKLLQVGLFFTALMLCLFGVTHSDYIVPTYLVLYTLGLAHHLIFDAKKSKPFHFCFHSFYNFVKFYAFGVRFFLYSMGLHLYLLSVFQMGRSIRKGTFYLKEP